MRHFLCFLDRRGDRRLGRSSRLGDSDGQPDRQLHRGEAGLFAAGLVLEVQRDRGLADRCRGGRPEAASERQVAGVDRDRIHPFDQRVGLAFRVVDLERKARRRALDRQNRRDVFPGHAVGHGVELGLDRDGQVELRDATGGDFDLHHVDRQDVSVERLAPCRRTCRHKYRQACGQRQHVTMPLDHGWLPPPGPAIRSELLKEFYERSSPEATLQSGRIGWFLTAPAGTCDDVWQVADRSWSISNYQNRRYFQLPVRLLRSRSRGIVPMAGSGTQNFSLNGGPGFDLHPN